MATSDQHFRPLVDQRGAAFARLVSRVTDTLNRAVEHRKSEGVTLKAAADKIGVHRSALSRVLNGTSRNLTLRTISDILWALEYEPQDFDADPLESINPDRPTFSSLGGHSPYNFKIEMNIDDRDQLFSSTIVVSGENAIKVYAQ